MKEIGIFPAAGGLGGSTYRHLLKIVPGDHVTLICRYPEKIEPEYRQAAGGVTVRRATYECTPQELELAFSGLDVLFLVSYPSHVHEYRVKVSCVVLVSGPERPRGSGPDCTVPTGQRRLTGLFRFNCLQSMLRGGRA